jgi:hypothetical protein
MADVRVAVLIDGGFLRVEARKAKKIYNPDYIERFALACRAADESLFRILYYDCALYAGTVKLPVSGLPHVFQSSDAWLHELSHKDLFAVRRGVLKFRGFKPNAPLSPIRLSSQTPTFSQILSKRELICESDWTSPLMQQITQSIESFWCRTTRTVSQR